MLITKHFLCFNVIPQKMFSLTAEGTLTPR